jgi:hypothetical protein
MKRLALPTVAVAFLLAACAGAATISNTKDKAAPVGVVQLNGGTNAGDISDVTNRPNPPVHKPRTILPTPAAIPQNAAPAAGLPSFASATDRCSGGIGIDVTGNRATGGMHLPQLLCPVE